MGNTQVKTRVPEDVVFWLRDNFYGSAYAGAKLLLTHAKAAYEQTILDLSTYFLPSELAIMRRICTETEWPDDKNIGRNLANKIIDPILNKKFIKLNQWQMLCLEIRLRNGG